MKLRTLAGLVVALALAAPAGAVAAPANVAVRVEGTAGTVVPRTAVRTTTAAVNKDGQAGHDCSGTSAAGALDRATGGDWAGTWFDGLGYAATRIRGQTADPSREFWALWVNYRFSDVGLCDAELQNTDDVLLFLDCFGAGCTSPKPLRLSRVPAEAPAGGAATVKVETFQTSGTFPDPTVTQAVPAPAATVRVGARTFTTGADGTARISFAGDGPVEVQATKANHVRSAIERTCVACGPSAPPPAGGRPVAPDTTAPRGRILGIREGQRFRRRKAPRVLRGTVTNDPSGIRTVKLRLTRQLGRRCWYFSGSRERFLARRCGTRHVFKVGDGSKWSYLLPERLRRGRYVLDVIAMDRRRNRDVLQRGRSRVVFHVR
jgi:hypothetical protein